MASQLSDYFETNHLLSDYKGAYRRGKSTEQLLLVVMDTVVQAIDNKNVTCAAFLDLQKAFDSLDHVILLQRLSELGVNGIELVWFTNYLTNRLQRVKIGGTFSDWGLVLFLIYMNMMAYHVYHGKLF